MESGGAPCDGGGSAPRDGGSGADGLTPRPHSVLRPRALAGSSAASSASPPSMSPSAPGRLPSQRVKALSCESKGSSRDSGYCADSPSSVASSSGHPAVFFMDDTGGGERPPAASASSSSSYAFGAGSPGSWRSGTSRGQRGGAFDDRGRRVASGYDPREHSVDDDYVGGCGDDGDDDDDDDETFYDAGNVTPARGLTSRTPPVLIPGGRAPSFDPSGASAGRSSASGYADDGRLAAYSPPPPSSTKVELCHTHLPRSCPALPTRREVSAVAQGPAPAAAVLSPGVSSPPMEQRNASTQTPSPSGQALLLGRTRGSSAGTAGRPVQPRMASPRPRSSPSPSTMQQQQPQEEPSDESSNNSEEARLRQQLLLRRLHQLPDLVQNPVASAAAAVAPTWSSASQRRQRAFSESSASQLVITEVAHELRRISDAFEEEHRQRRTALAAEAAAAMAAMPPRQQPAHGDGDVWPGQGGMAAVAVQQQQQQEQEGSDAQGAAGGTGRPRRSLLSSFRDLFSRAGGGNDGRPSSSWPSN